MPRNHPSLPGAMAPLSQGLIATLALISHHHTDVALACNCPLHSTDQNVRSQPAVDLRTRSASKFADT